MTIAPVTPFNITSMQSYTDYMAALEDTREKVRDLPNQADRKDRVPLQIATDTAHYVGKGIKTAANALIQQLGEQLGEKITALETLTALQAPNIYNITMRDGSERKITTTKEGMTIADTKGGNPVETTELSADGTKVVIKYEDGKPATKSVTEPNGANKTPIHFDPQGNEHEGDPIPVGPGIKAIYKYGYDAKSYDQTIETLSNGQTRITIQSKFDDEKYVVEGKLAMNPRNNNSPEFTKDISANYTNPEKGLTITTKGNTTTINDDKKGVDITITKDTSYGYGSENLTIQYKYKEGGIESSTITGSYSRNHPEGENNGCIGWAANMTTVEQVKFRDGKTATIKYENAGGQMSVSGVDLDENAWKEAGYNLCDKDERMAHVNPTLSTISGSYSPPFGYIQGLYELKI